MVLAEIKKKTVMLSNILSTTKVFEDHGDFIRAIIRIHVKNETEAEDLFQDFFLFLLSKPIPEEVQNIRGFLYRMISDKAKDASRRIISYQKRIRRYADRSKYIFEDGPDNIVIAKEESKKMFELIRERLPSKEAQAVTLRYKNSCEIVEVARKMEIAPRSVSRYVSVGLKKIRQTFGGNGEGIYDSF